MNSSSKVGAGLRPHPKGVKKDFRCKNPTGSLHSLRITGPCYRKKKGVWICIAGVWDLQTTTFWDPMILRVDWVRGSPPSFLEQKKLAKTQVRETVPNFRLTSFPHFDDGETWMLLRELDYQLFVHPNQGQFQENPGIFQSPNISSPFQVCLFFFKSQASERPTFSRPSSSKEIH